MNDESSKEGRYDYIPVPQAATVEIGTKCLRTCEGCAFPETRLETLSSGEICRTISTLSQYWDGVKGRNDHQLIGARIVELIGGAGIFNRMDKEDIRAILDVARANNLFQFAVMCDAEKDQRAIADLFKISAGLEEETKTGMKTVVALSVDALPKELQEVSLQREVKSNASWQMLNSRDEYIEDAETQNFRVFTTISKKNLSEIPEIAKRVLETGSVLFIAPLTIHSEEVLENTGVTGRLLMGTDTDILLDGTDREEMEKVVSELKVLKTMYPNTFTNVEATFANMLDCCKPLIDGFSGKCRERCAFITKEGEKLSATPNWRVMKRPGHNELTLGVCTCMIGPTNSPDNYANTALNDLDRILEGDITTVDVYRRLSADLIKIACPGCNCRTSIDIARGQGLK